MSPALQCVLVTTAVTVQRLQVESVHGSVPSHYLTQILKVVLLLHKLTTKDYFYGEHIKIHKNW